MSEYSPAHALSCMPRMCSSVDLPAPEGPMMETNSPGLMSSVIRRSTNVCPAPTGNDFSTPRSDMSGMLPVGSHGASVSAEDDERLKSIGVPFADIKPHAGVCLRNLRDLRRDLFDDG